MGTEETEDTVLSRNKQTPANASVTTSNTTTTTTSDLKIEERENVVIVSKNQQKQQQQPLVPTSTKEVNNDTHIQEYSERNSLTKKEEGEDKGDYTRSLSAKAQRAEESVSNLLDSLGTKAEAIVKKKFGEFDKALDHNYVSAVQDSSKIKELGPMVKELAESFEDTMTMIDKVPYEEQVNLFKGYKKLIEEQIKVIDSRIDMTKRLK